MSKILQDRNTFKPMYYPWAYDYFRLHEKQHWLAEEVPLHEDVKDWNSKLDENERNLLTQIFRFFTQGDVDVAAGYYDKYIPLFKHPELRMMMGSFANREGTHIDGYSLLLETVGMPETEYEAFKEYEAMASKHEYVGSFNPDDVSGLARTIAVYSAFTEGLQLFSSFAILLNFQRFGKMKGMGTIVEWSIKDESVHVEAMIKVFRTLVAENYHIWTDEFKRELYEIARTMVDLEDQFIDLAFEQGGINGLSPDDVKLYIRYICDRRLNQLGLKSNYGVETNPLSWLDYIINSAVHTNFFEGRSTEYTKGGIVGDRSKIRFQ